MRQFQHPSTDRAVARNTSRAAAALTAILISFVIASTAISAEEEHSNSSNNNRTPPSKICDLSGERCVRLVSNGQPKATDGDCALVISSKGKDLSRSSTYGYLLSAVWSPDGKYVAVNNRRANAGDYVWIFSLTNGAAIKVPGDIAAEQKRTMMATDHSKVVKEITRRFPSCIADTLRKSSLTARSWRNPNELIVREDFIFDAPAVMFVTVEENYRIEGGKFELLPQLIVRRVRELRD